MPSLGRRQFSPNKEQNDRTETCCTSFVASIETEVENDSALDREPNADTALMAVNGSEPTVDLVDAERSCSATHWCERACNGAGSRIRTDDLLITNQLLYQLSYAGICLDKRCNGAPRMLNAVYTTICTLLKQISRMTADTAAATGHALRTDDGIAASQKEGSPPMKTKSSRFDSITRAFPSS